MRITEIEAGVGNRVVRRATHKGIRYAKWSETGDPQMVRREAWALRRLRGTGLGPGWHRLDTTRDPPVLVMAEVQGRSLSSAALAQRLPRVAGLLARVHAIRPRHPGWGHEFEDPSAVWRSGVEMFGRYLELRRDAGLPEDRLLGLWGEALRTAGEVLLAANSRSGATPRSLCHGDLRAQNFLAGRRGLQLVDWEYACVGDPAWDLAWLALFNGLDPEQERSLLEAYGRRSGWRDSGLAARFYGYAVLGSLSWPLSLACRLIDVQHGRMQIRRPVESYVRTELAGAYELLAEAFGRHRVLFGWPAAPTPEELRRLGPLLPRQPT